MEVSDSLLQTDSALPTSTYTSLPDHSGTLLFPSPALNGESNLGPSDNHTMSQNSLQPVDTPDMDDAMTENVPAAQSAAPARATASSSGRGRGRGRWVRTKNPRVSKPAQPKAPSGRGRRQKVYNSSKLQAAHERAQELKQAFSTIVKYAKSGVQEIADRTINELLEDPDAYKRVPEYKTSEKFLDDRHQQTVKQCDDQLQQGLVMAEHVWQAQRQKANEEYTIKVAELCEERYGQLLRQLDTLEYLYDNNLPVDLPALPDERYLFKEITEEDANCQGVFCETEDGVEVPHSGKTITELMVKPQTLPLEAKRRAEGQPDGQPAAKVAATAKGADAVAEMPRHPAGLLGAAEAIEGSAATTPDSGSNAPTPTPVPDPAEEVGPERVIQRAASGVATPPDGPELPIPRGATDPDDHGVRLISRRPTRMDVPNNRVMVPNLFEWDDLDIGFRDSTNCAQKGATKQRRGKYLGRPGSNYMFIDRRAGIWDSTLAADELDEELVRKHKLHPTLGIVLPGSVNDWEPPNPAANGWKPVVFVPPSGEPIHSSRTIAAARIDQETAAVERRAEVAQVLRTFCEQEGISQADVAPDPEFVESHRTEILVARGIDPAQLAQAQASQPEPSLPASEPAAEDTAAFDQFVDNALSSADTIEAEEEATRMAAARRSQTSRPYDAIRDVFTDNQAAQQPAPPAVQDASPLPPADTSSLSRLADIALQPPPVVANPVVAEPASYEQPRYEQPSYEQPSYEQPIYEQPSYEQPSYEQASYEQPQAEYPRPSEYPPPPEPNYPARHNGPLAPIEPARTNDFLRTALNPQPMTPPPPMPPVQDYPVGPLTQTMPAQPAQTAPGRTPFSNTGATKALPALRPMRGSLNEPQTYPEPQGSPAMHHGNMVPSNSGAYYPPAPNRPFHNGYSLQDQGQPIQPIMPQQQLANPLQGPPHMGPAPLRRMSTPPPYHQPPPLGPAPMPQVGAQPPMHYPGPPPLAPAAAPAPRSRPGSSSAASAAAASKYRKLEPAPTPPHRLSYSGNGQELRTVQFDYREAIKDYTPIEAPPRHGPTQIRGWTHNNIRKTSTAAARAPIPSPAKGGDINAGANSDEPSA